MKKRSPCGKEAESVLKKAVAIGSPPSHQRGAGDACPKRDVARANGQIGRRLRFGRQSTILGASITTINSD